MTFTFTATDDMLNDDEESVVLSFGSTLPYRVEPATLAMAPVRSTVTITDDDVPQVKVYFSSRSYTVPEGGTRIVKVRLSPTPSGRWSSPSRLLTRVGRPAPITRGCRIASLSTVGNGSRPSPSGPRRIMRSTRGRACAYPSVRPCPRGSRRGRRTRASSTSPTPTYRTSRCASPSTLIR